MEGEKQQKEQKGTVKITKKDQQGPKGTAKGEERNSKRNKRSQLNFFEETKHRRGMAFDTQLDLFLCHGHDAGVL